MIKISVITKENYFLLHLDLFLELLYNYISNHSRFVYNFDVNDNVAEIIIVISG